MAFSNSPLVSYTRLSPNNSGQRKSNIDRITPHCIVGQISVESLGNVFANTSRQASCNYGIGVDGRVGLYCDEKNRSWCSSSAENDNRAVTIECASDPTHPYAFNNTVYNKLIDLCVDICKRNGKNKLIWFGDKQKTLSYKPQPNEMVITVHRWFKNKACPGDWLMSKMTDMVNKVNAKLGSSSISVQPVKETTTSKLDVDVTDAFVIIELSDHRKIKVCKMSEIIPGLKEEDPEIVTEDRKGNCHEKSIQIANSMGKIKIWYWMDKS